MNIVVVVVVVMVVVGVMVSAFMLRSQRSRTGGCESLDKLNYKHASTFGMECNTFFKCKTCTKDECWSPE